MGTYEIHMLQKYTEVKSCGSLYYMLQMMLRIYEAKHPALQIPLFF